jgi:hypothetical protein
LENTALWQDEAETAFYAKQILDFKLPNGYDEARDLFLYIGALIPISNSSSRAGLVDPYMYAFVQEDFADDGTLIKHPYGDIAVTALSFLVFGPSTFSARFFFALMGVFSLVLTYNLARYLYNQRVGLISMAFQTFNIVMIAYERQARYYSLTVFCFLGFLYFGLKALDKCQTKDYVFATMFCIGLIAGNPVTAISALCIMFLYDCYRRRGPKGVLNKKVALCLLAVAAFVLAYGSFYQPWRSWHTTPVHFPFQSKVVKTVLFMAGFSLDCSFLLVCLGMVTMLYRRRGPDILVVLVLVVSPVVHPLFTVYSSLFERLLLATVPFLCIAIARFLDELYVAFQKRKLNKLIGGAVLCTVLFTGLILPARLSFPGNLIASRVQDLQRRVPSRVNLAYHIRFITGRESYNLLRSGTIDPQWVSEAVAFLKDKGVGSDEWVFTTFHNAVFLFYSDLRAQLIWPVRKSFLDSYQERFWILIGPHDAEWSACQWFYKFSGREDRCKERNYFDRIKTATTYTLSSGATVYECSPLVPPNK